MAVQDVAVLSPVTLDDATIEAFRASLRGRLLRPDDEGYDAARRVWNGMIDRHPALIARCAGVADVVAAVEFARANDLLVSVRGGGHNVTGNAVCDGGLMIDLSPMKGIRVDPERRTAWAQAGLTWGEFDAETQAFGLATTGGQVSTTGIAGLTLGGGLGWLMRRFGLAVDNLLSVDVVLADGRFVTATADEHADLFWGLRGGGGNFGVATAFEYRLHPVGPMVTCGMTIPGGAGQGGVGLPPRFRHWRPRRGDGHGRLGHGAAGALRAGGPARRADGRPGPLPLRTAGGWAAGGGSRSVPSAHPRSTAGADALRRRAAAARRGRAVRAAGLPALGPPDRPGRRGDRCHRGQRRGRHLPHSVVSSGRWAARWLAWASTRPPSATGPRRFSVVVFAIWTDPDEAERHLGWGRAFGAAMRPFSRGVYVNEMGAEGEERVRAAYNPASYERLVALKTTYDPTNFFRLNQNIRPAT